MGMGKTPAKKKPLLGRGCFKKETIIQWVLWTSRTKKVINKGFPTKDVQRDALCVSTYIKMVQPKKCLDY
jgi:hypothetical protein